MAKPLPPTIKELTTKYAQYGKYRPDLSKGVGQYYEYNIPGIGIVITEQLPGSGSPHIYSFKPATSATPTPPAPIPPASSPDAERPIPRGSNTFLDKDGKTIHHFDLVEVDGTVYMVPPNSEGKSAEWVRKNQWRHFGSISEALAWAKETTADNTNPAAAQNQDKGQDGKNKGQDGKKKKDEDEKGRDDGEEGSPTFIKIGDPFEVGGAKVRYIRYTSGPHKGQTALIADGSNGFVPLAVGNDIEGYLKKLRNNAGGGAGNGEPSYPNEVTRGEWQVNGSYSQAPLYKNGKLIGFIVKRKNSSNRTEYSYLDEKGDAVGGINDLVGTGGKGQDEGEGPKEPAEPKDPNKDGKGKGGHTEADLHHQDKGISYNGQSGVIRNVFSDGSATYIKDGKIIGRDPAGTHTVGSANTDTKTDEVPAIGVGDGAGGTTTPTSPKPRPEPEPEPVIYIDQGERPSPLPGISGTVKSIVTKGKTKTYYFTDGRVYSQAEGKNPYLASSGSSGISGRENLMSPPDVRDTRAKIHPPPYSGGGAVIQVNYLPNGDTQTITASGAVIVTRADDSHYRQGYVDPKKGYDLSTLRPDEPYPGSVGASVGGNQPGSVITPGGPPPETGEPPHDNGTSKSDNPPPGKLAQPTLDPTKPAWHQNPGWQTLDETKKAALLKVNPYLDVDHILEIRPGADGHLILRMDNGDYKDLNLATQDVTPAGEWDVSQWESSAHGTTVPVNPVADKDVVATGGATGAEKTPSIDIPGHGHEAEVAGPAQGGIITPPVVSGPTTTFGVIPQPSPNPGATDPGDTLGGEKSNTQVYDVPPIFMDPTNPGSEGIRFGRGRML